MRLYAPSHIDTGGTSTSPILKSQFGVLPYRTSGAGHIEPMLITSRSSRRWVIPPGNPIRGVPPHLWAARQADEEAGIIGHISEDALGSYEYLKRLKGGGVRPTQVHVFLLAFARQLGKWAESHQRDTRGFTLKKAATAVQERGLRRLIRNFVGGAR